MAEQSPAEQPLKKKSTRAANTHTYMFKISLLEKHRVVGSVSLGMTARTNQNQRRVGSCRGGRWTRRGQWTAGLWREPRVRVSLAVSQKPLIVASSLASKHM